MIERRKIKRTHASQMTNLCGITRRAQVYSFMAFFIAMNLLGVVIKASPVF
jgi:hypothetical protein